MKKLNVPIILGIITLAELIITHGMGGSIALWVLYGIYRMSE